MLANCIRLKTKKALFLPEKSFFFIYRDKKMITTNEKNLKRITELLKSQIVYNHMLELMGIQENMVRRLPLDRFKRMAYDQTRPEIQAQDKETQQILARQLHEKEKKELTLLLKSSALSRYQAMMQALIDYAVHVDTKEFERNLQRATPPAQYCCGASMPHKVPANRIREY